MESENRQLSTILTEKNGKLGSLILAGSIAISISYDWGFYFALGITFSEAPTTLTDHLQSWLIWLPWLVLSGIILLGFELFLRRMERGMTEEEIVASSRNPSATEKARDLPYQVLKWLFLIIIFFWVMIGEIVPIFLFFWGLGIWWMSFVLWVLKHQMVRNRIPVLLQNFILFLPFYFFIISGIGMFQGEKYLDGTKNHTHRVHFSQDSTRPPKGENVTLLRTYQDWVLVMNRNQGIQWIDLDQIGEIEVLEGRKPWQGVFCKFGISCQD